jgi:hypothetical protein
MFKVVLSDSYSANIYAILYTERVAFVDANGTRGSLTNTNATNKEIVEFHCNAVGDPVPSIQWFMNGEPLGM